MPINVFGNSNSNNNDNKFDTSLFVQKPYLRTNYIESNIEEDIDLKINIELKILLIQQIYKMHVIIFILITLLTKFH